MATAPLADRGRGPELTVVRHPPRIGGHPGRRRLIFVTISALLVIVIVGTTASLVRQPAVPTPPFVLAPVTRGDLRPVVRGSARAQPWVIAHVAPAITGRVERVSVQVGDHVTVGDTLATLQRRPLRLAVRRADALLAVADAAAAEMQLNLGLALEELDISEAPGEALADSEVAATIAYARSAAAQAEVAAREVTLNLAEIELRAATLRATATGVVAAVLTESGATVTPDSAAFVISDTPQRLRAVIRVGDSDLRHVSVGQPASVVSPGFPGRTFRARVAALPTFSDAGAVSAGLPVTLSIDNPAADLLVGMGVTATIEGTPVSHVLRVPEAALRFVPAGNGTTDESAPAVWTLRSGEPVRIPVLVGVRDGGLVEVQGDELEEGSAVVIAHQPRRR